MSRSRHTALAALTLTVITLAAPQRAAGQGWGDRLKKRAEEPAKRAT